MTVMRDNCGVRDTLHLAPEEIPLAKKEEHFTLKREGQIRNSGDDVFERLSSQNTAAFQSLSDRNLMGKKVEEPSGKPRFFNFLSNSSDETASTLSSSLSSYDASSTPRAHSTQQLRSSSCLSFDSHVESLSRQGLSLSTPTRERRSRPTSLPRGPTQTPSSEKPDDRGARDFSTRPPRARDASPFHERLASQQTKASAQRIQDKPPLPSSYNRVHVDYVPFIPFVHSSAGSVNGSEISSITDVRFPTPPPRHRRKPNMIPTKMRESRDDGNNCRRKSIGSVHDRLAATETKSLAFKKGLLKDVEQKKKVVRSFRSQDALFYRLSRADTVASSRRKPSPLRKSFLTPYEMDKKKEQIMNKKVVSPARKASVYERLSTQGTLSSMRKARIDSNQRYNSEYETFGEGCKTALMRRFEGSTFVYHH